MFSRYNTSLKLFTLLVPVSIIYNSDSLHQVFPFENISETSLRFLDSANPLFYSERQQKKIHNKYFLSIKLWILETIRPNCAAARPARRCRVRCCCRPRLGARRRTRRTRPRRGEQGGAVVRRRGRGGKRDTVDGGGVEWAVRRRGGIFLLYHILLLLLENMLKNASSSENIDSR